MYANGSCTSWIAPGCESVDCSIINRTVKLNHRKHVLIDHKEPMKMLLKKNHMHIKIR